MICEKPLQIVVTENDFEFWPMEEAAGNRIDAVMSAPLVPSATGTGSVNQVAGKIAFAAELDSPTGGTANLDQTLGTGFPYVTGDGITVAGWFNGDLIPTDGSAGFGFFGSSFTMAFSASTDLGGCVLIGGDPFGFTPIPSPSMGAWHFFILELVPGLGQFQWEIDRNGVVSTQASNQWPNGEGITLALNLVASLVQPGMAWAFDQTFFAPYLLTTAQKDYLWNGGAGRTMPIVLP